jgi:hypothetical protein
MMVRVCVLRAADGREEDGAEDLAGAAPALLSLLLVLRRLRRRRLRLRVLTRVARARASDPKE